jgi:signal transduction histidine kinase
MNVKDGSIDRKARTGLLRRYLVALRAHLGPKRPANRDRPQGLGRAALASGWAARDLAVAHEQALVALASTHDFSDTRNGSIKRAGDFFTQALIPLESAQRATRQTNRLLQQRNETLRLHTAALAKSNRLLQREISRRKAGEAALRNSRAQYQQLFVQSQVMQRKLRQLTRQILSAQEEERKEISRELHDEVVQTLVGINVQLSALSRSASAGMHSLKAKIARTQRLVENSVNEVHRFARELRPAVLDDLGLIPALHAYCKNLARRKKIKIQLTAFAGVETLQDRRRAVLYRVAQEALTNVIRHAQATQVDVGITKLPGVIRLEIGDNGKSFAVEKTLLARNNKRLGLVGMRERIEMIGGSLAIISAPGEGTIVRAEIPFDPEKIEK